MKALPHHLIVGDDYWCDWIGSQAGQDVNAKAGHQCCGHHSLQVAQAAAKALRPYFKKGRVKVIAGACPRDIQAQEELAAWGAEDWDA